MQKKEYSHKDKIVQQSKSKKLEESNLKMHNCSPREANLEGISR
jgi:hypothetical protein